jgi:hypothetical protein
MASFNQQYFNPYYIPQVSTGTVYSSREGFQSTVNPATRVNMQAQPQVPTPAAKPSAQAVVPPVTIQPPVTAQPGRRQVPPQINQPVQQSQQAPQRPPQAQQQAQQTQQQQAQQAQQQQAQQAQQQQAQQAQQQAQQAQQLAQQLAQQAQTAAQQGQNTAQLTQQAKDAARRAEEAAEKAQRLQNSYSNKPDRHLPSYRRNRSPYWGSTWDNSWDNSLYYNQPRTVYIPTPVAVTNSASSDLSYCNQYANCGGMNADPTSCTKCVADRQGGPACANYVCNDCASSQKCAVWKGNPYYSCRRCMGEQNANPACADQICGPDPNA